jgi:hypothetical protein
MAGSRNTTSATSAAALRSHTNSARRSGVAPRLARHDSAAIAMTAIDPNHRPRRRHGASSTQRCSLNCAEPGAARRTVSATIASAASTPSAPKVAHSPIVTSRGAPRRRAIAAIAIPSTATAARSQRTRGSNSATVTATAWPAGSTPTASARRHRAASGGAA